MEGFFVWFFFSFCAWWCSWHLPGTISEGSKKWCICSFISKRQSCNESCTADEVSQKQDLFYSITDLKAEQNFMVEMPSSVLKVSSVLFFQVDQKLITPCAGWFSNMWWWRGDNSSFLFIFSPVVSEIWVSIGFWVCAHVINAVNSLVQDLQLCNNRGTTAEYDLPF